MAVFILEDDMLHVQPLHPGADRVARLYRALGHGFYADAQRATARLDSKAAGMILGLLDAELVGTGLSPASHRDILGLTRFHFALNDLRRVAVGEHFPELAIEVRGPGNFRETYDLTPDLPPFFAGHTPPEGLAFSRGVTALFEASRAEGWRGEWIGGWLDRPAIEWEKVDEFPEDTAQPPGYRTSPQQGQRIVAERDGGGVFERLVRALVPGGARSPRRVVLTREEIFADFGGEVFMLPRGLPTRAEGRARIFGRFAGMILEPRAERCPVVDELFADLSK